MTEQCQTEPKAETKRDRVRRLLIDPLSRDGMRFPKAMPEEVQRKKLDQMADDFAHMTDANLGRLMLCLRTKGGGSQKDFWPSRITQLGYAQVAQPRPLEDDPKLKSWFVSAAGRAAAAVPGRLIAEFQFFKRHHHPPYLAEHKRLVASQAGELAHRLELIADREQRGIPLSPDDAAWVVRYRQTQEMLVGWIDEAGASE